MEGTAFIATVGEVFTVMVTVAGVVFVQPAADVAVTVYTVVAVGLAVVVSMLVFVKPVAGLQL